MQKETLFIVILHLLLQHRGSTVTHPRVRHGHTYGCSRPLLPVPRHVEDNVGTLEVVTSIVWDNAGAPEESIGDDIGVDMGALEGLPVEEAVNVGRSFTVSMPCCEVMLT
jgi:hypothetical protein